MATASVIEKSLSPSPPPPSAQKVTMSSAGQVVAATSCPCKSCLVTQILSKPDSLVDHKQQQQQQDEIVNRKSTNDLEEIAYSIVMLIMEGRTPIPSLPSETETVGAVAASTEAASEVQPTDAAMIKASRPAKRVATVQEGAHSKQLHERLMHKILNLNSGRSLKSSGASLTIQTLSSHQCSAKNQQCRIASKLKEKIRKCTRYHYGKLHLGSQSDRTLVTNLTQLKHCANVHLANAKQTAVNLVESSSSSPVQSSSLIDDESAVTSGHIEEAFEAAATAVLEDEEDAEIEDDNLDGPLVVIDNLIVLDPASESGKLIKTIIQIEVYLLATCCFDELVSRTGENLIEAQQTAAGSAYSSELLERWNISMITNKNSEAGSGTNNPKSLLSLNELFQAIRSYLYFSQISSWINQTKGQQPKNVAFSVRYLDENEDSTPTAAAPVSDQSESVTLKKPPQQQQQSSLSDFDFQTFPNINLTFLNNNLCLINSSKNSASSIITTRPFKTTGNTAAPTAQTPANSIGSSSLTSTSLIVNLFSRKRRNSPPVQGVSIPQIACSRSHHFSYAAQHTASRIAEFRIALSNREVKAGSPDSSSSSSLFGKMLFKRNSIEHEHESSPPLTPQILCPGQVTPTPRTRTPENAPHSSSSSSSSSTGRQHYYLPHWSSIMTPSIIERRRSSIEASELASKPLSPVSSKGNEHLLSELLRQQHAYYSVQEADSSSKSSQTPSPTPVAAALFMAQRPGNEQQQDEPTSPEATGAPDSFMFGLSPKVLVSNHQLMMDLCTTTQNQLKLSDLNNNVTASDVNLVVVEEAAAKQPEPVNQNKRKFLGYDDYCPTNASSTAANTQQEKSKKQLTYQPAATGEFQNLVSHTTHQVGLVESQQSPPVQFARKDLARFEVSFQSAAQFEEPTILSNSSSDDSYKANDINNNVSERPNGKPSRGILLSGGVAKRSNFPLSSSPAPVRKSGTSLFGFDSTLKDPRSIKNALAVNLLSSNGNEDSETKGEYPVASVDSNGDNKPELNDSRSAGAALATAETSSRASRSRNQYSNECKSLNMQLGFSNSNLGAFALTPNCLLGSFEESLLNGRMNPVGLVDGFYAEIGASGSFFPEHATLPVYASFYQVCEDVAASPYLGVINLSSLGKRGYKVPNKGTIQVTLFNPNNTVVKMFVVMYDLSDMPPNHRTFLRQRTMYVPLASSKTVTNGTGSTPTGIKVAKKSSSKGKSGGNVCELEEEEDVIELKSYLRYLIHLRFATSKSGKMYLHTNVKLIFARNKCEIDPRLARYEYKTFTEAPKNPRYSPKK